jgi:hypothetical protein
MAPLALALRSPVVSKLGSLYAAALAAATVASAASLASHAPAPTPFAAWELPSAE